MYSRIKAVRSHYQLSQDEFASALELTKNYISLIENGKRIPSDRTISDICRTFHVDESWLREGIGGDDIRFAPSSSASVLDAWLGEVLDEPDGSIRKQVLEALSRMKPEFWHAWADFCEELVNIQEAERSASPEDPQTE